MQRMQGMQGMQRMQGRLLCSQLTLLRLEVVTLLGAWTPPSAQKMRLHLFNS